MINKQTNEILRGAQIAATVLQQLGGRRFLMMTGTKPKYYDDKKSSVTFELKRNKSKAKYMTITLNGMDTYDIKFFKVSKDFEHIVLVEKNDYYNDMLVPMFEEVTGFYTTF